MQPLEERAREFLSQKRIAVTGVSRKGNDAGNVIYKKLKESGHSVFAVNPHADTIENDACYHELADIPGGVDGVVIVNHPRITEEIVRQCIATGVTRVWMHRSIGNSVSDVALKLCEENSISVIAGACPMMFAEPVDFGHKCLKWFMRFTGKLPT